MCIRDRTTLLRDLSAAQNIANNLRIDYHFLFNTLNTIASMTIENEREDIYNAIIDLSKMLRYNMNTNQRMIELKMCIRDRPKSVRDQKDKKQNCPTRSLFYMRPHFKDIENAPSSLYKELHLDCDCIIMTLPCSE